MTTRSYRYLDRLTHVLLAEWETRDLAESTISEREIHPYEVKRTRKGLLAGGAILVPGDVAWLASAETEVYCPSTEDVLQWAASAYRLTKGDFRTSHWLTTVEVFVFPRELHCRAWGGMGGALVATLDPEAWGFVER